MPHPSRFASPAVLARPLWAILLYACSCLPAGAAGETKPHPNGAPFQYYQAGAGFACVVPRGATTEESTCNRVGPLKVLMPVADLVQRFGVPAKKIPRDRSSTDYIYMVSEHNYVAVTIEDGRVVALQVTGPGPLPNWTFSGVSLGMTANALQARLGEPKGKKKLASEGRGLWKYGAVLWSYEPWSFTFEVAQDRVISIRVGID